MTDMKDRGSGSYVVGGALPRVLCGVPVPDDVPSRASGCQATGVAGEVRGCAFAALDGVTDAGGRFMGHGSRWSMPHSPMSAGHPRDEVGNLPCESSPSVTVRTAVRRKPVSLTEAETTDPL